MKLLFRIATLDDAATLFAWRNDPVTRQMSKTSVPVSWEDHVAWLTRRLQRQRPDLFIVQLGSTMIGTIRLDEGHISYTIAPECRGQRLASAMLKEAGRIWGPLVAEIKPENEASIRAAKSGGHIIKIIHQEMADAAP